MTYWPEKHLIGWILLRFVKFYVYTNPYKFRNILKARHCTQIKTKSFFEP